MKYILAQSDVTKTIPSLKWKKLKQESEHNEQNGENKKKETWTAHISQTNTSLPVLDSSSSHRLRIDLKKPILKLSLYRNPPNGSGGLLLGFKIFPRNGKRQSSRNTIRIDPGNERRMTDSVAETKPQRKHLMFIGPSSTKRNKMHEKKKVARNAGRTSSSLHLMIFFCIIIYLTVTELIILLHLNWLTE